MAKIGRLTLPPHTVGTGTIKTWTPGVSEVQAPRVPRTLRVAVPMNDGGYRGWMGGDPYGGAGGVAQDCVLLRIKTGDATERVFYADCQPGEYSIPATTNVTVDVARWAPAAGGSDTTVAVHVELSECHSNAPDYRPFTLTNLFKLQGGQTAVCTIPDGAYAFDVQTHRHQTNGTVTTWESGAAGAPNFETTHGPFIRRDFENLIEMPAGLVAITGPFFYQAGYGDYLEILNKADPANTHFCKPIFYVR